MKTKKEVMQRIAKAMTKSLKAQGHAVPLGNVLNALAASDGNFNWHVLCQKLDQLVPEDQPSALWVGIYQYEHGKDVYAASSQAELLAKKQEIGLGWINREYSDDPDLVALNDEQKAEYFWHNFAHEESFEIERVQLLDNADEDAKTSDLAKAVKQLGVTNAWAGIHCHKQGLDVYLALTREGVYKIRREIALENIQSEFPEYVDEGPMSDEEKADYYWERVAETSSGFFDVVNQTFAELESEEAPPAPAEAPPKRPYVETSLVAVVSTAHVTREEAKILDAHGYRRGPTGWFLYVDASGMPVIPEIPNPSEGLAGAIEIARERGCHYLLLDRDAEIIEGVKTYDW